MTQNVNNSLGAIPAGIQLTGNMVDVEVAPGQNIQLDSALVGRLKSIEIGRTVTRANGTVEVLPDLRTEF